MNSYQIAVKLSQGEPVDRKKIDDIEGVILQLQTIRNDCITVIKQLKEAKGKQ